MTSAVKTASTLKTNQSADSIDRNFVVIKAEITALQAAQWAEASILEANTAITTAGNGVLTAAALAGRLVTRTGPTSAYTDTTDTATAILAAVPDAVVGTSFEVSFINGVAYAGTIAAGEGVTLAGTTAVSASKIRRFLLTVTAINTPAVSLRGIGEMTA